LKKKRRFYSYFSKIDDAQGIAQHHDAVSGFCLFFVILLIYLFFFFLILGTAQQHVTYDYAKRLAIGTDHGYRVMSDVVRNLVAKTESKPLLGYCDSLNVSICPTINDITKGKVVPVIIYNPLAVHRTHFVRLPVPIPSVNITDATGMTLNSEVLLNNDGSYTVHFNVSIYPLGFTTVFISQSSQKSKPTTCRIEKI
jgi:hypothetical protein